MFNKKTDVVVEHLDREINALLLEMYPMNKKTDPEYPAMVEQLTKLWALKENSTPQRVSADVKATIAANLVGILLIVRHENVNVITSKALGFVQKLR